LRESDLAEYPDPAGRSEHSRGLADRSIPLDWVDELSRDWKKKYPQLDLSSLSPLVRLARLSDLIDTVQSDVLEPFELTSSDYGVLATLRRAGRPYALSPSQLHGQLRRSSGGMTKILKRLEASGLVERRSDAEDGRKIQVTLTSRGRSLHDRVFRAFAAASNRLLAELTDGQKTEIDRALKQLHDQLEHLGDGEIS
jgi:DNA-binding MarR family transcriptional regulator